MTRLAPLPIDAVPEETRRCMGIPDEPAVYSVLLSVILNTAGRWLSVKGDMRPRITNKATQTFDVHCFSFESAGALGFVNEYARLAVTPAHYIAFAELKHRTSRSLL